MKSLLMCVSCFILLVVGCTPEKKEPTPGGYYQPRLIPEQEIVAAALFAVKEQASKESSNLTFVKIVNTYQLYADLLMIHLKLEVSVDGVKKMSTVLVYRDISKKHQLASWVWDVE